MGSPRSYCIRRNRENVHRTQGNLPLRSLTYDRVLVLCILPCVLPIQQIIRRRASTCKYQVHDQMLLPLIKAQDIRSGRGT